HVDAEMLELARDGELLLHVHGGARRLLSVAQRRVEDLYAIHMRASFPPRRTLPHHDPKNTKATVGGPARGSRRVRVRCAYTDAKPSGGPISRRPRSPPRRGRP